MAEVEVIKAVEGPILRKRDYEGNPVVIIRQRLVAYVRVNTDDEEQYYVRDHHEPIGRLKKEQKALENLEQRCS